VNHYEILQVRPNADCDIIEAAAKALLKKRHPDHTDGTESVCKRTLEARETLTDVEKRRKYDARLRAEAHGNTIGSYRIVRKIAEGGFGRVYEGVHNLLGEKVCIKHNINVSDYDTQLFIKEAKSIWSLRHHALPAVRDFIMLEDGSCALVMTYIDGATLFDTVQEQTAKGKLLDPENVCWMIARVLDGLRYLHYFGVVHGDVKPQNIIVQPTKHACTLVDFGLSSVKPGKDSRPEGYTPMFASPESLTEKPLLPESDLYSLGLTMIFALGGDVQTKKIPDTVPGPIRDFIADLIVYDVKQRPRWDKVNLLEQLKQVRLKVFGREHTNDKKIKDA